MIKEANACCPGCQKFTDFGSRFMRHFSGGLFSVKAGAFGRRMQTIYYP
jgi:hypothetical protein